MKRLLLTAAVATAMLLVQVQMAHAQTRAQARAFATGARDNAVATLVILAVARDSSETKQCTITDTGDEADTGYVFWKYKDYTAEPGRYVMLRENGHPLFEERLSGWLCLIDGDTELLAGDADNELGDTHETTGSWDNSCGDAALASGDAEPEDVYAILWYQTAYTEYNKANVQWLAAPFDFAASETHYGLADFSYTGTLIIVEDCVDRWNAQ